MGEEQSFASGGAVSEVVRVAAVIALVTVAAVLATPPGRMPLALRGLGKLLGNANFAASASARKSAPLWKRTLAFLLVSAAAALALV